MHRRQRRPSERSAHALALGAAFAIAVTSVVRPPVRAQDDPAAKTSGIVRSLVAPGTLDTPPLGFSTDLEKAANAIDPTILRANLRPLEMFVQLNPGVARPLTLDAAPQDAPGAVLSSTDVATVVGLARSEAVVTLQLNRPPDTSTHPVRPFNRDARRSHFVDEFNGTYPGIDGSKLVAAVFDNGRVRASHIEFRTDQANPASTRVLTRIQDALDRHATHVAGTIAAQGLKEQARGMAPAATILSFSMRRDLETLTPLGGQLDVTNHSYGPVAGWDQDTQTGSWYWWGDRTLSAIEDARFGKYTGQESALDTLLNQPTHQRTLAFIAAGNDRNDTPGVQPITHYVYDVVAGRLEWRISTAEHREDGFDGGGLDTVSGYCLAKNVVCIGSIHDVVNGAIAITPYSGWGPADDGRVKPDLVANGQNLLSTADADDESYVQMPGTSMASPVAAGIALLAAQQFTQRRGRQPVSSELKAVLIHTATDAGTPGPDPAFGWGSVNALAAGHVVARSDRHSISTVSVGRGEVLRMRFTADGQPIRVTGVWMDPAAPANLRGLDDTTQTLQNDLDLELVSPAGTVHHPYALNRTAPLTPATRTGANRVDNVEVIDAMSAAGSWELRISGARITVGAAQRISIVTSGLRSSN